MPKIASRPFRMAARAVIALSLLTLPAFAGDVKISNSTLTIDSGQKFFRGKATNVQLGSYGEKKTPIGSPNYLAIEKNIAAGSLAKIPIKVTGPIPVEWSKVSSSDIAAGASYLKAGGGSASLSVSSAKSANLVLVKFSINEGDLKDLLNKYATEARDSMKREGNDARVVSEVYVAMEATLASSVTRTGSASASATAPNGLQVEVSGSSSSTSTTKVTIPPNTTFAYLLHKVTKWDGSKVSDMQDDQSGLN